MTGLKKYEDGSTIACWPARPDLEPVTFRRSYRDAAGCAFSAGETASLPHQEVEAIVWDGTAVRVGECSDLDETPQLVMVVQPFTFRWLTYRADTVAQLPAFFAARARQLELVGDVPPPEKKRELSDGVKEAIKNRRIQRQRKVAHEYLESIL